MRIASLDGWRGIAILLVLFDHFQIALFGRYLAPWTQTGQHGVTIFFVLSGYLITSKLIEKPINLKEFYWKRFWRLMPAAWAYLATLLILGVASGRPLISEAELASCLLFYRNFVLVPHYYLAGHFWSLSLEEQFYMVWPCCLLLVGARRAPWIAGASAFAFAAYRYVFWAHYDNPTSSLQSQVRADALLLGCLFAFLMANKRFPVLLYRRRAMLAAASLSILCVSIAFLHWLPSLCECLSIAILISLSTYSWSMSSALSVAPLAWLGLISYSVYLWQEPFIYLGSGVSPSHLCALFVGMPLTAIASYYIVERPGIALGRVIRHSFMQGRYTPHLPPQPEQQL